MHTRLAYRAKYGCDMSDMRTDVEMQVGPVLDQRFCVTVTLPVHTSVWDHIFDDDYHVCLPACRPCTFYSHYGTLGLSIHCNPAISLTRAHTADNQL